VVVTVKAQATHFPGASEQAVLDHARSLAAAFLERGYTAEEPRSRSVTDPGNPERTLDTAVEIPLSREVGSEDELFAELRVGFQGRGGASDDGSFILGLGGGHGGARDFAVWTGHGMVRAPRALARYEVRSWTSPESCECHVLFRYDPFPSREFPLPAVS